MKPFWVQAAAGALVGAVVAGLAFLPGRLLKPTSQARPPAMPATVAVAPVHMALPKPKPKPTVKPRVVVRQVVKQPPATRLAAVEQARKPVVHARPRPHVAPVHRARSHSQPHPAKKPVPKPATPAPAPAPAPGPAPVAAPNVTAVVTQAFRPVTQSELAAPATTTTSAGGSSKPQPGPPSDDHGDGRGRDHGHDHDHGHGHNR